MTQEDLKTLVVMGRSLWSDPGRSERVALETMTAVSLLDLTKERAVERAAAVLLERAERDGMAAMTRVNLVVLDQPFFRLLPEERFLLAALHVGRWSYSRLARVMDETSERVEEIAWMARVRLSARHPAGPASRGHHCPDYDVRRPWTQRFLDEEMETSRERLFLQNHLMACDSCRQALGRSRDVYYQVEALLPRADDGSEEFIGELACAYRETQALRRPSERTFIESLQVFGRRADVRWALLGLLALVIMMIARL